jgi:uncharacterized surface protein with fasciclin (FAS1) repeats
MTTTLRRTGIAAMALTVSFGLAACGSDDDSSSTASEENSSETTSEEPTEEATEEAAVEGEFGDGCAAVPADGPGSFQGMSTAPVATAASNNPVLSTLVTAVGEAELVDTLNTTENLTVFAPANDAFAAIPEADLNALLADKQGLTDVLTYHVVGEQLAPEDLAGTFETLNGAELTVEGEGEEFTVGDQDANVICGNVQTANATVYIIDGVLMPAA